MLDLNEMKQKGIYEYNHYWELERYELANICKELAYEIIRSCGKEGYKDIEENAIDNLIAIEQES